MTRTRLLLLLILSVAVGAPSPCKSDDVKTLVVMIDHDSGGFHQSVGGKPITPDLLTFLREHKEDWPVNKTKAVLLVHNQTNLTMIDNSRGIIEKAGYEPPRVFYFDGHKRAMVELTFSNAVPFSQSGNAVGAR